MRIRTIGALVGAAALCSAGVASGVVTVKVGVTVFPPYIVKRGGGNTDTLSCELLDLMNSFQSQYRFEPVPTGPLRRHREFELGRYDLSTFDNLDWGWKGLSVKASEVYMTGAEVYIARDMPERDQSYFLNLEGKAMIGMRGYHYGFAKYNADPDFLQSRFNMILTNDNEATIKMLLAGRGDIAVVTEAYLADYFTRHPEDRPKLLVSKRKDQIYAHTIIVRDGVHPTVDEINQMLKAMRKAGVLEPLQKKYAADALEP